MAVTAFLVVAGVVAAILFNINTKAPEPLDANATYDKVQAMIAKRRDAAANSTSDQPTKPTETATARPYRTRSQLVDDDPVLSAIASKSGELDSRSAFTEEAAMNRYGLLG